MAYTVGQNVVRMQGQYWMQPPRVTTIVYGLKQRVKQGSFSCLDLLYRL